MHDLKQIAATLKYGPFDGTKRKYIISAFFALTVLLTAGMIAVLILSPVSIRVQIIFKYNGRKYAIKSGNGNEKKGYLNFLKQYADKSVAILFSPKYEQVIILK